MSHAALSVPFATANGELHPVARAPGRERWSWALYDFANTIFSMNVASLFFAVWIVSDLGAPSRTVGYAGALSSLLIVISIPIFGAISDARQRRKSWVVGFTLLTALATIGIGAIGYTMLPAVGDGIAGGSAVAPGWRVGGLALTLLLAAFVIANYAYQGALPFYNAMMPELAPKPELGRLSGLGTALGYVGSIVGVLLVTCVVSGGIPGVVQLPPGVVDAVRSVLPFTERGGRVSSFVPTALLLLLFSLPLFLFCRDHNPVRDSVPVAWKQAFGDLARTVRDARKYPGATRFIVASFLYQDAMGTIIGFMALYAVEAMGFEKGLETTLFVVLTVPAVIGSYICGILTDRVGPKRALQWVIGAWIVLLMGMIFAPSRAAFWVVGVGIGLIFGGVATAERPLLLTLVPDAEAGRFFSLMVLSARAAAIAGPLIWTSTVDGLTPSLGKGVAYRLAVVAVAVAMALALWLLRAVPDRHGQGAPVPAGGAAA